MFQLNAEYNSYNSRVATLTSVLQSSAKQSRDTVLNLRSNKQENVYKVELNQATYLRYLIALNMTSTKYVCSHFSVILQAKCGRQKLSLIQLFIKISISPSFLMLKNVKFYKNMKVIFLNIMKSKHFCISQFL